MKDMYYKMTIAGCERELPLCPISDELNIGAFVIFGDPELTTACAEALNARAPEHDVMITAEVRSITTDHVQTLCLDGKDAEYMRGKRVLIVDDVISTGESLHAMEELVHQAGGRIVGRMAILAEGDATRRADLVYLEKLPLFNKNGQPIE